MSIISHSAFAETEISFSHLSGDAEGYLQTPAGGGQGTTSPERPALKELGIDSLSTFDFSIGRHVRRGKHELQGGGQIIRAESTATLSRNLTSQNQNFPAGSVVHADLQADWFRFNWLYRWRAAKVAGRPFVVSPGAGLVLFDFHYKLKSDAARVDRTYAKLGYRVGGEIAWQLADNFALQFEMFEGLPLDNTPRILSAGMRGEYALWEKRGGGRGALAVGVDYHRIDYEDRQPVANHIRIETGPLFKIGLNIRI